MDQNKYHDVKSSIYMMWHTERWVSEMLTWKVQNLWAKDFDSSIYTLLIPHMDSDSDTYIICKNKSAKFSCRRPDVIQHEAATFMSTFGIFCMCRKLMDFAFISHCML